MKYKRNVLLLLLIVVVGCLVMLLEKYDKWQAFLLNHENDNVQDNSDRRLLTNFLQNRSYISPPGSKEDEEDVTWVLLLSYQRTGSSFIGGIFNDPGNVFYVYEPLDPLYAAMYGIDEGWTVPNNVFNNIDGSLRTVPKVELLAAVWTLEHIYNCNMSSLPPAILAHKFWSVFNRNMSHTGDYLRCLNRENAAASSGCQRYISRRCGKRFGTKPAVNEECRMFLWGDSLATNREAFIPNCNKYRHFIWNETLPKDVQRYFQCLIKLEPALTRCAAQYLDRPCKEKKLRAVKTVRANMEVGELLLKSHQNFKLIHLYRDPRGAVRSRVKLDWACGVTGKTCSAVDEVRIYCSHVQSDVRRRIDIEQQGYLHRIKEIIYDVFIQNPLLNLLDVYDFIGHKPSAIIVNNPVYNTVRSFGNISYSFVSKRNNKTERVKEFNLACSQYFNETKFH